MPLGQADEAGIGNVFVLEQNPHPDPPLFEPEPQSRRPEYQGREKEGEVRHAASRLAFHALNISHRTITHKMPWITGAKSAKLSPTNFRA